MQQSDHYEYMNVVREYRRVSPPCGCKGSKKQQRAASTSTATRYNRLAQMAFFGTGCIINEQVILQDQEGNILAA